MARRSRKNIVDGIGNKPIEFLTVAPCAVAVIGAHMPRVDSITPSHEIDKSDESL